MTREEILEALRESPAEVAVGEGRDVRVLKQRRIEEREALNHIPAMHAPYSEELAPLAVKSYAEMASCDYIEGFNFRAKPASRAWLSPSIPLAPGLRC